MPYSEGMALVTDGLQTYAIDKEANILFTLPVAFKNSGAGLYTKGFQNGLVQIGDNLYDQTGKEIKPADVGVTKFYDGALSGGYIIAEKEEATYNSTVQMLGIMNTAFEWVVPLNKQLYQSASRLTLLSKDAYAIDGYIIDGTFCFEIATSTCYELTQNVPKEIGEYGWVSYNDGSFRKGDEIVFTVEGGSAEGQWVDGKHVVSFYNGSADKYFFTVIDTTGEFLFEPVEMTMPKSNWGYNWAYDGQYIVVSESVVTEATCFFVYDTTTGASHVTDKSIIGSIIYNEGVVVAYDKHYSAGAISPVKYYDLDGNQLF